MKVSQLVWLRNDLRLDDNPALYFAQQRGGISVVFCATPQQWLQHDESAAKLGLKAASLKDIARQLADRGIPFTLLETAQFADIPTLLSDFCKQQQLTDIWFNQETALDERRRDSAVCERLSAEAVNCHALPPDLLVSSPVLTQKNEPFKVFTAYYRRWLQILQQTQAASYPSPNQQAAAYEAEVDTANWAGPFRQDIWPAEEEAVLKLLVKFCQYRLKSYPQQRDFPAQPATSQLSPYLTIGRIGPRRLLASIQYHCLQQQMHWQDNDWLRELAWRDFYRQLLLYFPGLSMKQSFRPETKAIVWRNDEAGFQAWCDGQTGFPIVDAAMCQLKQTGWMHNRLRMVVASFLTKLLFIDWRRGEQFFMQHLIDGDFAANNGGWQWSASTGCDAAPYFRVFNPLRQSERFDPTGDFIRRFIPELSQLDNKQIHNPSPELRQQTGYPMPVIDYKAARQRAIASFAKLQKTD